MIEIKHRYTCAVLYRSESAEDIKTALEQAVKARANLARANLDGADLARANLYGANLDGANLGGANLYGANLYGAISMTGLRWPVLIFFRKDMGALMHIGCQRHAVEDWAAFDDDQITKMDLDALNFWREWKTPLLALCKRV